MSQSLQNIKLDPTEISKESGPGTSNDYAGNDNKNHTSVSTEDSGSHAGHEQSENSDDDESNAPSDSDALTTMNAIMAYNRQLVARLHELENKIEEKGDKVDDSVKEAVEDLKDTVPNYDNTQSPKAASKETANDYKQAMPNYDRTTDAKGTNHSFEFPIGDMMMGSGNFNTTPLEDKQEEKQEEKEPQKKNEDEETVKGDNGSTGGGDIRIGDGDKDDIVIKVEATKKGITFCIHIPRN